MYSPILHVPLQTLGLVILGYPAPPTYLSLHTTIPFTFYSGGFGILVVLLARLIRCASSAPFICGAIIMGGSLEMEKWGHKFPLEKWLFAGATATICAPSLPLPPICHICVLAPPEEEMYILSLFPALLTKDI